MFRRNIDMKKKIQAEKPRDKGSPGKEIKINLKINLGRKPWRILIFALLLVVTVVLVAYLVHFRSKIKELDYQKGVENLSKGNFDEATKNFENASAGKNEGEALYKLAVSKYNQKDYNGAIEAYQRALEKKTDTAPVYNGMANLYRDQKNYPMAEQYYEKAVATDGSYVVSYTNWAIMLMDNGDIDGAKGIVEKGLEKNPESKELANILKML